MRWDPAALVSFLLGLCSLALCLLALTGIPAIVFGLRGLRRVNTADGRLRGRRLALAGLTLGTVGTAATMVGAAAIVVVQLRATSYRVECVNRLRQIGIALNKYADTHQTFPPATRDPAALPPERRLSWLADVLPLLAEGAAVNASYQELARQVDRTRGWDDAANAPVAERVVRMFLCPAHPDTVRLRSPGRTDYVGVAGVGPDAAALPRSDRRAGLFGNDRGVKRDEVAGGISHTLMVLETAWENGPWLAGGFPTARGVDPGAEPYSGWGRPFGGLHPGVVNALWVDGAVRPLADDTAADVFRRAATLAADAR
ncbi:MAG: DUF1559 domain-containing protein [Gemmataceae bacterium]